MANPNKPNNTNAENNKMTQDGYSHVEKGYRPISEQNGYSPVANVKPSIPPPPPSSGSNVSKPANSGK